MLRLVAVHDPTSVRHPKTELSPEVSRSRFKCITQHFWRGRVQIHTFTRRTEERIIRSTLLRIFKTLDNLHIQWQTEKILILKTIGNRKGDCAWSCSRWQTQPEKICKSQRTNQCHSLRTLYWFVRCDLQIFSGCVCHLEQLHAQSPFLFPIVFSINLIPFFDICSVDYLLFFHPGCSGMCCFTWAAAWSQQYTSFFLLEACQRNSTG